MALISEIGSSSAGIGQDTRCRRSTKKEKQVSPAMPDRYGFLKQQFAVLIGQNYAELKNWRKVETEFFTSLSNLCSTYSLSPIDVSGKIYPYNILLAYRYAADILKTINPDVELTIIQDEAHSACLATVKRVRMGMTLYYIPVEPLYRICQERKRKKEAGLLLSVFSYLYNVAGMPYFRGDSYMSYLYEMLQEWIVEGGYEENGEEYNSYISSFNIVKHGGDVVKRKVANPYHLQAFSTRVDAYNKSKAGDEELLHVAQRFLKLWQHYPRRSFMDNIHGWFIDPEEEQRMYPDQYLSFFWSDNGSLYEALWEAVNNEFQELGAIDDPLYIQVFDKPHKKISRYKNSYEKQLLQLLCDLNDVLCKI